MKGKKLNFRELEILTFQLIKILKIQLIQKGSTLQLLSLTGVLNRVQLVAIIIEI
jgi:hypothetical protein